MTKYTVLFILIAFSIGLQAQTTTTLDNNPASLKWYQVNTDHFRILYPQGFEDQAQRMANTLEHIRTPEAKTMGESPRKISVVLQNQSSISNGFVTITPRRSEFYTMPSQNYNFLGTNDWLNMLASHEYRHIVQYQHATRGFNRLFYYLFGANTLSAMSHVAAPQWFWEGDAVATETAFTHSGRGRIPNFDLLFKTNLLEGRTFNYHKQYLRSYKHNIPDHYVLGFHMISYLRKRTNDPEIWEKITARSWNVPFIPFRFSSAIKMETGLHVTGLYKAMAMDLKKEWQAEIDSLRLTSFEKINPVNPKAYTDYSNPQILDDGSVLAMRNGIGSIDQFVILKDGHAKKVYTPGFVNETGMLSVVDSKVVWNEFGYDPRWGVRNYSLVKVYDFKTKKKWVLGTKHDRYAGGALSPYGNQVVTVRTDNRYKTTLIILDFPKGNVVKEFPNPENDFISMPRWSADGKSIVALKTTSAGRTISWFDVEAGTTKDLLPLTRENIGHPVVAGDYILYNSPVTGIDNIFAVDITRKIKYQITSSKYGAYNPSLTKDGKTMFYNDQGRDGLNVVKAPFDPQTWKPFEEKPEAEKTIGDFLAEQEGRPGLLDSVPRKQYEIKRYSKLKGIINPYNWGAFIDNNLAQASVGINSQDILSTTQINAGYQFDIAERTGLWKAGLSYQGLYPILDVTFTSGKRSVDEGSIRYGKIIPNDTILVEDDLTFKWTEQNLEAGLRIPLNLTSSKYSRGLSISDYVGYTSITDFKNSIDGGGRLFPSNFPQFFYRNYADKGNLIYNHAGVSFYNLLKTSRRDINSKWGQVLFIDLFNTPYGGDYSGKQFSLYGLFYFPGIAKHHSIWSYWAYQSTEIVNAYVNTGVGLDSYTFRNQVPLPRGIASYVSRFQEFYSMSVNYTLPVWYPDISIGPLLNIQRVRVNAFFDYAYGQSQLFNASQSYSSTGAEVKFDFNLMRFLPQFNLGFRYSKGINPSVTKFEVLIGTIPF